MKKVKVFRFTTFATEASMTDAINDWLASNNATLIDVKAAGAFTEGGVCVLVTYEK